jgi:hypothetical protein
MHHPHGTAVARCKYQGCQANFDIPQFFTKKLDPHIRGKIKMARNPKVTRANFQQSIRRAVFTWISLFNFMPALAQDATKSIEKRDSTRKKERWQFSDYLTQKKKLFDMDLVYRMYTSQREKPYPRIEPMFEGGIASVKKTEDFLEDELTQAYFGRATLHFNNFISGIFKIPTPNIVPGALYQITQSKRNKNEKTESIGFSLRIFSKNQQDGALFLEGYRSRGNFVLRTNTSNNRPSETTVSFLGWENRVRAQLYLFPSMGLSGAYAFKPSLFKQRGLETPERKNWEAGAFLEFKILRLGYLFQSETWSGSEYSFQNDSHVGYVAVTL